VETTTTEALRAALGDRYFVEHEIARGGMATVFLASDRTRERLVALKVLHPELALALGAKRFRREIAIAAQLQHPHILPLLDSGATSSGLLWFTMPYVDGESLRDRLQRERQLPLADAMRIVCEVAAALDHAHERGVIHRDIKPENILLGRDGRALLADFGVARDTLSIPTTTGDRWSTDTGVSVGTLEYMSPEQTNGERNLDARTDVYSLGCVLYEMLAGEPPFTGATPQALIARRLVERPLPLRAVRDRVPTNVERAVDTALSRAPADRFGSAREFAEALQQVGTDERPSRRLPHLPAARAAAAIALVGAAVLLAFAWQRYLFRPAINAPVRVAVLRFENAGDSGAGYLADGVAEAIRSKLGALPELQVIGRASSAQYHQTTKSPQVIAAELGAPYLLTGRVHRASDRTEVQSQLMHVVAGAAPQIVWRTAGDSADVFRQESDVAARVASAMGVVPTEDEARRLADQPTTNPEAYNAYLQGQARMTAGGAASFKERIKFYERAVALDSTFGAAWASLSIAHSDLYYTSTPTVQDATAAADALSRAQALSPGRPETQSALATYEDLVHRDAERARLAAEAGLAVAPDNVSLLGTAGSTERSAGLWDLALAHERREEVLDPRTAHAPFDVGTTLLYLRRYPEAIVSLDRAVALDPRQPLIAEFRAIASLGQGDTSGASAVLHRALAHADTDAVGASFAEANGLYWLLDPPLQQRVLSLGPDAFDDRATWAAVRAEMYWARGDTVRARVYADSGSREFANELRSAPTDDLLNLMHGLMLAFLGRNAQAIAEGEHGAGLAPLTKDHVGGLYDQQVLAQIYMVAGDPDKAIDHLHALLQVPSFLSPARLRIDPTWVSLRGNARFQALIQ
jgi:eukaryotic-like serine/threonine-protein kinase